MMTITYLLYTDEWRVEWDGYVSVQHDLATAIDRVIDRVMAAGSQVAAPA
jgi:hypothetical protein